MGSSPRKAQNSRESLAVFDGHLLDGFNFCRKVYELFEAVRRQQDGIRRLRLRRRSDDKRLVEELIPIARYVQARYREGCRVKVRWFSGSQPYDAVILCSGSLVEQRMVPRRSFLEVTTAVHKNEHLLRRLLDERGGAFGVKGISRNKRTKQIVSQPYVHTNDQLACDLAEQILDRLKEKSQKNYPRGTVLIVNCVPNCLITPSEWNDAMQRVCALDLDMPFREVFFLEAVMCHSMTIYSDTGSGRRRSGT